MTSVELTDLANRARAESVSQTGPVTPKDTARIWKLLAVVSAHAAMLAARVEALEARPKAGRPPGSINKARAA